MQCEFCDSETTKIKVKRQHWLQGKLYIIENVEAEVKDHCGEKYFHARTIDNINRLLQSEHDVKERIEVEVVML
jgi:YgiT-type zinc finger domain-containing protein